MVGQVGPEGGGGSSPVEVAVLSATTTLTNAQIKTLPTTPIVIVPATEVLNYSGLPTQMPLPLAFSVTLDVAAGAYTNVDTDAEYVLALGSDWSSDGLVSGVTSMAQLASSTPQLGIANSFDNDVVANLIQPLHVSAGGLQDNALAIAVRNGVLGNLTGGNAANGMKVTVLYTIIDL